jgi:hypothetical protein
MEITQAAWTIDEDLINGDTPWSRAGRRYGPEGVQTPHRYRVKDADGEVYYIGRCSDESSFAPLDFAMADAGATDIEYQDTQSGRWIGL